MRTLLRLHSPSFCLDRSGFGLHLLPEGGDGSHCCLSPAWEDYDLQLAGVSISVALFPCPPFSLKGEHEAGPRQALFPLLMWAPLMERLPQEHLLSAWQSPAAPPPASSTLEGSALPGLKDSSGEMAVCHRKRA